MVDQLKFVQLEMMVLVLGLAVLIADLWMAPSKRRLIGHLSALSLGIIFLFSPVSYTHLTLPTILLV